MTRTAAYGKQHQKARLQHDLDLATLGPRPCRRCGEPVHCDRDAHLNPDGQPFDLGHGTDLAFGGTGADSQPEHRTCNRSAGGRLGNLLKQLRQRPPTTRDW